MRRRRAKNNWLRLVTTMRNVNIADCENLFIKDEYRHIVFSEEDLLAVISGEYVLRTPSVEEDSFPNKRVTWRESLEEAFYDTEDECVIVDVAPSTPSKRRLLRKQFSVDDASRLSRPPAQPSHSAPGSPALSSPRPLRRSRSAERSRVQLTGGVSCPGISPGLFPLL